MAGLLGQTPNMLHAKHIQTRVVLPRRARIGGEVLCMAHPRRVARVAKQIEREVGSLLIYDKVLQQAVCPERKRGMDGALSALASVTDVQMSNDLQVAKVFLSIYSDDAGKEAAMAGLQRLEGYVRKHVGRAVRLRLTPEIRFVMDESIERTERVFRLLEQVRAIEAGEAPPPPIAIPEDEEEEYVEEGIVGVELGFFDDEEEEDSEYEDDEYGAGASGHGASSEEDARDYKSSSAGLSNEEVEEMMALFRQESAGGAGAKGRGGSRGGGRSGGNRRGGGGGKRK